MYDDILVPVDGSHGADVALTHATELAGMTNATMHLLHVIELIPIYTRAAGPAVLENDALAADREEDAQAFLAEIGARLREDDIDAEVSIRRGNVHEQINRYATDEDIDLIVIGSHGRNSLGDLLLGSTAEKVVRTATVPVLTVPAST